MSKYRAFIIGMGNIGYKYDQNNKYVQVKRSIDDKKKFDEKQADREYATKVREDNQKFATNSSDLKVYI